MDLDADRTSQTQAESSQVIYRGYDREGLEAQYSLRPRHPERDAVYARYGEESAMARATMANSCDIRYGAAERQVLDVFPAGEDAPLLLFFHGGYWRALDKSMFSFIAQPYVEAGWTVVLPNYTLAPAAGMDAIVDEARQAAFWVARHVLPEGRPLVVAGHSAGGHLAMMTMLADWTDNGFKRSPIAGGMPISGLFDLEPIRQTSINAMVGLTEDQARRNSPALMSLKGGAPLFSIAGGEETDEFKAQTTRFDEAWRNAGSPGSHLIAEGHTHFSVVGAFASAESAVFKKALAFLTGLPSGAKPPLCGA